MKSKTIDWLSDVVVSAFDTGYSAKEGKLHINLDAGISSDGYRVHIHNKDELPSDADEFVTALDKLITDGNSKGMLVNSKYLYQALSAFDGIIRLEIIEVEAVEGPGSVLYISDNNDDNEAFIMSLVEEKE